MLSLSNFSSNKKTILIVTDTMQPGGVDSYIFGLITNSQNLFKVELLIEKKTTSNLKNLNNKLCIINESKLYHRIHKKNEIQKEFNSTLKRILPDIVHVVCGAPWSCLEIRNIIIENNIPLIFTEQFINYTQEINAYIKQLREIYLNCFRVIFVNESNAIYLLNILNLKNFKKFDVIYNSIDLEKVKSSSINTLQRQRILYSKMRSGEKIKILVAARYVQQKGLDILINSASLFNKSFQNLFCINIFGEGIEESNLKALAKNQDTEVEIKFYPWTFDLLGLFNIHDLFIYPSLMESLPFTLIEALANHIPTIASDIEPNLIVTNNGKFSGLFKTGNSLDLAKKIEDFIQFIREKNNYFNNIKECDQWLADNFSNNTNCNRVIEIWNSAL